MTTRTWQTVNEIHQKIIDRYRDEHPGEQWTMEQVAVWGAPLT
jgi:hypothetical protein